MKHISRLLYFLLWTTICTATPSTLFIAWKGIMYLFFSWKEMFILYLREYWSCVQANIWVSAWNKRFAYYFSLNKEHLFLITRKNSRRQELYLFNKITVIVFVRTLYCQFILWFPHWITKTAIKRTFFTKLVVKQMLRVQRTAVDTESFTIYRILVTAFQRFVTRSCNILYLSPDLIITLHRITF